MGTERLSLNGNARVKVVKISLSAARPRIREGLLGLRNIHHDPEFYAEFDPISIEEILYESEVAVG